MQPGVAFLIDADNLATPAEVEEAFERLTGRDEPIAIRRAYGGHEKLGGLKDVLRRFAVRSSVNQGRGTTDVALVVDAMDLLHHGGLPATVAIASSDADFAPLALRLREAGRRLVCFAQREKADMEALAIAYDEVIFLGEGAVQTARPSRGRAVRADAPAPPAVAPKPARPAARAPAARKVAARPAPAPAADRSGDLVAAILEAAPALRDGRPVPLNDVTRQLRDAGLLGKSARSTTLLGKLADHFRLAPEGQPSHVQWRGAVR